jgi:hypothetical protein
MTHSSYGKEGGAVRLSIGLESPSDIIADLKSALSEVAKSTSTRGNGAKVRTRP